MRALILLAFVAGCAAPGPAPLPPDVPVVVQDPTKCADVCAAAQSTCPTLAKPVGDCVTACSAAAADLEGPLSDLAVALTCNP
jgi:hypothetical protein